MYKLNRSEKAELPVEFIIDETFNVPGVGTVVAGTLKQGVILTNSNLLLGPYPADGSFKPASVKSIHYKRLPVPKVCPFALQTHSNCLPYCSWHNTANMCRSQEISAVLVLKLFKSVLELGYDAPCVAMLCSSGIRSFWTCTWIRHLNIICGSLISICILTVKTLSKLAELVRYTGCCGADGSSCFEENKEGLGEEGDGAGRRCLASWGHMGVWRLHHYLDSLYHNQASLPGCHSLRDHSSGGNTSHHHICIYLVH